MIPIPERFRKEFNVMFKATTEAGLVCRKLSEKLNEMGVMTKSDASPVTRKQKGRFTLLNNHFFFSC